MRLSGGFSLIVVAVLALAGCSSLVADGLSRKYTQAARSLGINPVYPPREDLQVGDVYLMSAVPGDPDSAVSVWVGTVDAMKDEVDKFLRTRVVFEDTGAVSDDASKLAQTDLFSPGISTRSDERVVSLPVTAYPSITLQGGETATGGLVGAMAALGFGTSDQTTLTLDFNDVRTYWVPKVIASRYRDYALNKFGGDDLDVAAVQLPSKIAAKAEMEGHKSSGTRCLTLAIVTQVYLTRKIDYTYADREIVAAGLKIATQQGKVQDVAAPPAITVNVLQSGDDAKNDSEAAAKIAEALRTSTAGVGSGAEGGSFSFVSWNARGLTFQKTFQRPVAIGWDGFEFGFTDTNLSQRPCQNINNLM